MKNIAPSEIADAAARGVDDPDPDVRILRRVAALKDFTLAPRGQGPFSVIGIVDTETTGTDPEVDEVIDLALVTLEINGAGEIVRIISAQHGLRQPSMPIPPAITAITGISDADVQGLDINVPMVELRLHTADVLIAHCAKFDIGFVERLIPGIAGAAWACSANDFDWLAAGFDGRKLGHLVNQIGYFNDAHRAMTDVVSLVNLLAHRLPSGRTVLADLLDNASRTTIRLEATGAPYSRRHYLKRRGCSWDADATVWWIELAPADCDAEEQWLRDTIIARTDFSRKSITWHDRHR
jgi:DNA polymerase III subunit epsilon